MPGGSTSEPIGAPRRVPVAHMWAWLTYPDAVGPSGDVRAFHETDGDQRHGNEPRCRRRSHGGIAHACPVEPANDDSCRVLPCREQRTAATAARPQGPRGGKREDGKEKRIAR